MSDISGKPVNKEVNFDALSIFEGSAIQLTIGIKDDARHKGGINLFGKNFGVHFIISNGFFNLIMYKIKKLDAKIKVFCRKINF